MEKTGIYAIRNIANGKRYIGQTIDIGVRERKHFNRLRTGTHYNSHLQFAFQKYGEDSFEFMVLETVPLNMLDEREKAWIVYYKSYLREFGYNVELGGVDRKEISVATRNKISLALLGKTQSIATRLKRSVSRKKYYQEHPEAKKAQSERQLGSKRSVAVRRKMSNSLLKFFAEHPEARGKISKMKTGKKRISRQPIVNR